MFSTDTPRKTCGPAAEAEYSLFLVALILW